MFWDRSFTYLEFWVFLVLQTLNFSLNFLQLSLRFFCICLYPVLYSFPFLSSNLFGTLALLICSSLIQYILLKKCSWQVNSNLPHPSYFLVSNDVVLVRSAHQKHIPFHFFFTLLWCFVWISSVNNILNQCLPFEGLGIYSE